MSALWSVEVSDDENPHLISESTESGQEDLKQVVALTGSGVPRVKSGKAE